jgi:hypothetical protein
MADSYIFTVDYSAETQLAGDWSRCLRVEMMSLFSTTGPRGGGGELSSLFPLRQIRPGCSHGQAGQLPFGRDKYDGICTNVQWRHTQREKYGAM